MEPIESRISSKGQISIPTSVRRRLGLVPGARLEWLEKDGEIVVRCASRFSSKDIHDAIFDQSPPTASMTDMDVGIRAHLKNRHARR